MSKLRYMSKKQIITVGIVIAIATIITLILLFFNNAFNKKSPVQQRPIPQPVIESNYGESSINIESLLKESDIFIPSSLPLYSVNQTAMSFEESSAVASRLGFSEGPQSLNDVRYGLVYIWSNNRIGNLRIVAGLHIIDYKVIPTSQPVKIPFNEEPEIISKATRFLISSGLILENSISSPHVRYLNLTEEGLDEVEKEAASAVEVRFEEALDQYPIINATPDVGTINITLDRESSVISVYIDKVNIIKAEGNHRLKTFSSLLASIRKAKILSLDNGNIDLSSLSGVGVIKITVNNANIGYYQEFSQNQSLLQPVFILRGFAQLRNGDNASAILYLPALADLIQR